MFKLACVIASFVAASNAAAADPVNKVPVIPSISENDLPLSNLLKAFSRFASAETTREALLSAIAQPDADVHQVCLGITEKARDSLIMRLSKVADGQDLPPETVPLMVSFANTTDVFNHRSSGDVDDKEPNLVFEELESLATRWSQNMVETFKHYIDDRPVVEDFVRTLASLLPKVPPVPSRRLQKAEKTAEKDAKPKYLQDSSRFIIPMQFLPSDFQKAVNGMSSTIDGVMDSFATRSSPDTMGLIHSSLAPCEQMTQLFDPQVLLPLFGSSKLAKFLPLPGDPNDMLTKFSIGSLTQMFSPETIHLLPTLLDASTVSELENTPFADLFPFGELSNLITRQALLNAQDEKSPFGKILAGARLAASNRPGAGFMSPVTVGEGNMENLGKRAKEAIALFNILGSDTFNQAIEAISDPSD